MDPWGGVAYIYILSLFTHDCMLSHNVFDHVWVLVCKYCDM